MGLKDGSKKWTRISPYLPSLRRIPAKIILPATGASTWALGSHRWNINIGIFTKKARTQNNWTISLQYRFSVFN